jgi:hypothetical protein
MGDVITAIFLILLVIILSPILLPLFAYQFVKERIYNYRFQKYIRINEGAKYFCYTSNKSSVEFVRANILPSLREDVNVLYFQPGLRTNLGDDEGFPYEIARKMKALGSGFPCVAKITDGEIIAESLNRELYNAIRRKADAKNALNKINRFLAHSET